MKLTSTTTVLRPPEEVYAFWRDLSRLPDVHGASRRGPRDRSRTQPLARQRPVRPDRRVGRGDHSTRPGERIAWRSIGDADVPNAGKVRFVPAPAGEAPRCTWSSTYDVPGGAVGKAVAKYFGEEPHQQLDDDLRRLKQVLETGEVVRSDGAPGASGPARSSRSVRRNRCRTPSWRRERTHEGEHLDRAEQGRGPRRAGPEDPEQPRRDRPDHLDRDLRLGPAPGRRVRPDDAGRRRDGPRVHGRGDRGRSGRRRRPSCGSGTGWSCRSRSPAVRARPAAPSCTPAARTPTPTPGSRRRCSATRSPGSSATRT